MKSISTSNEFMVGRVATRPVKCIWLCPVSVQKGTQFVLYFYICPLQTFVINTLFLNVKIMNTINYK